MSHEWLLIGFPVVFALGWLAGRLDIRHIRKTAGEIPVAVLRGLSHLLGGDEGKALDAFLAAPAIGATPTEFQFAVGELLRRRGEHKRALQTHRRLYERENLPPATRHRALLELATDYAHMGFVDLAERHAKPLLADQERGKRAFALLLNLYQQRRRYEEALAMVDSFGENDWQPNRNMVAQWLCLFALAPDGDDKQKQARLLTALNKNPDCARANLALADLALAETPPDAAAALRHLRAIERQNPDYLWLAAGGLARAHAAAGSAAAGKDELRRWLADYPSPMMLQEVCKAMKAETASLTEEYLAARASAAVGARWAEARDDESPAWPAVKAILRRAAGKPFVCAECGYEVSEFSWQCRGCMEWESLRQQTP